MPKKHDGIIVPPNIKLLQRFMKRLCRATSKRRTCSKCGGQFPKSWFHDFLQTEKRDYQRPTFYKGKWYLPKLSMCKICKGSGFKADRSARIVCAIRENGEARDDRESKRHRQAA